MAITQRGENFARLNDIMDRLLAEDGCPWDREQTLHTLKPFLIEEAYEVLEAIEEGAPHDHCEELGDLLFQIVFQAALRAREGQFGINDVVEAIATKMVRRHPHVFAELKVKDAAEVLTNWGRHKA
jgi:MazG family protein